MLWDAISKKCINWKEEEERLRKEALVKEKILAILDTQFIVFFDWNDASIPPQELPMIQKVADAWQTVHDSMINVIGYTDRSLSPATSKKLSESMANNVANILVENGVPRSAINVEWRGENDNRVPTAPGRREPQNRRVEMKIVTNPWH